MREQMLDEDPAKCEAWSAESSMGEWYNLNYATMRLGLIRY